MRMTAASDTRMTHRARIIAVFALLVPIRSQSFVPSAPTHGHTMSYWTTWYTQNYPLMRPLGGKAMGDLQLFAPSSPANGSCPGCGWAQNFFPAARADMLLVLDDTWFVQPSTFDRQWQLDPVKFPDEAGAGTRGASNWTNALAALVALPFTQALIRRRIMRSPQSSADRCGVAIQ